MIIFIQSNNLPYLNYFHHDFLLYILLFLLSIVSIYSFLEMEFLDIILTKDSSRLLHAIHSPF
jgi:hypothetical protein